MSRCSQKTAPWSALERLLVWSERQAFADCWLVGHHKEQLDRGVLSGGLELNDVERNDLPFVETIGSFCIPQR